MQEQSHSPSLKERKITPEKARILIRRIEHSVPIMTVMARVLRAIRMDSGPVELTKTIGLSPELSMRVMRVANSASANGVRVHSIRQAVDLLGLEKLANIVLTIGMREYSKAVPKSMRWKGASYQRRSVATAFVSQLIAQKVDPEHAETHYLCGLFQEWGYLVLAQFAPTEFDRVAAVLAKTPNASPTEVEDYYIGTHHSELGAIAAEEYGMFPEVIDSLRYHHDPAMAPDDAQLSADVAHVASWVAGEMALQVVPCTGNHQLDPFSLQRLGWSLDDINAMQRTIIDATKALTTVLEAA